jgi:hypothetical protein
MSEGKARPVPAAWWQRPIGIGLLGLALMVGGWKLRTWVPVTAHEQEQAEKLGRLREAQGAAEWKVKVDGYSRSVQRQPPYEMLGRLAVFAGLVLFVVAGVRMYRAPAGTQEEEKTEEPEGDEEEEVMNDQGMR